MSGLPRIKGKSFSIGGSHANVDLIAAFANCDDFLSPAMCSNHEIKLIQPDLKDPRKNTARFWCPECGLPRTYFNYLRKAPHSRDRRGGRYGGSRLS